MNLKTTLKFTERLAEKVGKYLLNNQNKVEIVKYKDKQDIVTNIDLKCEKIIISQIEKYFPNHNIFSEESGIINKKSDFTWVIDPLDGTKEYFRKMPTFGTCLSLETISETILGCVYIPATGELYSAIKGSGAYQNGNIIHVSSQNKLSNSFIYSHPPTYKVKEPNFSIIWKEISLITRKCYRLRTQANDAWTLCWLAKGGIDGYILLGNLTKWHDLAPGLIIAKQAGATITDKFGKSLNHRKLSHGVLVSNGKIHDQLLEIINK